MSNSSFPSDSPLVDSPFVKNPRQYALSSDLARLCLPAEYKDSYRRLAWVNSICFLFLVIGLVGLKAPQVFHKPVVEIAEPVPVVFTPPEEEPKMEPEMKQEESEPQETPLETPQVVTVVAAADPATVAFAVPVQGAVAVAEARFASAPPPVAVHAPPAPPVPTRFDPNATDGGTYPKPDYPSLARRNRYQGTVTLEIFVEASGNVRDVKIRKTSSFPLLDDAAVQVVKQHWRFPPGGARDLLWDCIFQLK
jgi:protein TonB